MSTNQRTAARVWEFLFPPSFSDRCVCLTTVRKAFLHPSLDKELTSETIELCGILTFWRIWISFYSFAEVKFCILQRAWECRCSARSKRPDKKNKKSHPSPTWVTVIWEPARTKLCHNIPNIRTVNDVINLRVSVLEFDVDTRDMHI